MTSNEQNVKQTAKFITYVLGHQPDEFGLIPDNEGFVPVKTLLKAMHEEQGWRHLRVAHFNELSRNLNPCPIEIKEDAIRAKIRDHLPRVTMAKEPPKLLYTAIRQRAYPVVLEKGIRPGNTPYIILSADKQMAQRLGRRIDNQPILITVQVADSQLQGVVYQQFGSNLYLASFIPVGSFTGPALPKEKPQAAKPVKPALENVPMTPGSFFPIPDLMYNRQPDIQKNKRAQKKKSWQTERRLARKYKRKES